jgi:hypothetical protein
MRPIILLTLSAAALLLTEHASAEVVIIDDPLLGTTQGQQVGGTLSSEGYAPTGAAHILYELPETVREGYLEVEIFGMDPTAVPVDADHGFLGMYDGRGIAEPVKYFDDFKQNFFRWNVHWRQNRSALKAVISCAAPTEERLKASIAVYPTETRDFTSEPTGSGVSFDPTRWHAMRAQWQNKKFEVLVDGAVTWSTSGPYDYAPVLHRIWVGSAPGSGDKYLAQVPGIRYRNVRLVSFDDSTLPYGSEGAAGAPSTPEDGTTTDPDAPSFGGSSNGSGGAHAGSGGEPVPDAGAPDTGEGLATPDASAESGGCSLAGTPGTRLVHLLLALALMVVGAARRGVRRSA